MKPIDLLSACFTCRISTPIFAGLIREDLFQIAEKERVLPALLGRLKDLGVSSQLPTEVVNFLSAVESLNVERNQAIFSELAAVATLLNGAGIEPVLLKGAAYCALGVYASPAARYLMDVDLLIPSHQLSTAVQVLLHNGFQQDHTDRLCRFRHHHAALRRPGAVPFELHHSLGMGICNSLLPASEVLEQSVSHDFHGARVRVPSPEHLMAHLIMHSQIQHPYEERIWPPLRAMYDLVILRRRFDNEIDWGAIQRRFRKTGQSAVLALHLIQVRDALGAEPPFPIRVTGLTQLRWLRRKLLRAMPAIRFLDPIYMYSTILRRRLRLLRNALDVPGGWKQVAKELIAPAVYKRLISDIVEGPGR